MAGRRTRNPPEAVGVLRSDRGAVDRRAVFARRFLRLAEAEAERGPVDSPAGARLQKELVFGGVAKNVEDPKCHRDSGDLQGILKVVLELLLPEVPLKSVAARKDAIVEGDSPRRVCGGVTDKC